MQTCEHNYLQFSNGKRASGMPCVTLVHIGDTCSAEDQMSHNQESALDHFCVQQDRHLKVLKTLDTHCRFPIVHVHIGTTIVHKKQDGVYLPAKGRRQLPFELAFNIHKR